MIRDAAVAEIALILGNRKDKDAEIVRALIHCQEQMETTGDFYPWFLTTENAEQDTGVREERVELPSNFLSEIEADALWIVENGLETPLTRSSLDLMKFSYPANEYEKPRFYDVSSVYIRLRPKPDRVYRLKMTYIGRDLSLSDNIENKWLKYASRWLMGEAGVRMATVVGHSFALKTFQEMVATGKRSCYVQSEARTHTNVTYYLGS